MREDDWGPAKLPFHAAAGGPLLTPSFDEAASRLLFLAERRWPAGLLVGPCGCGKSTLLKHVRRELRLSGSEAVLLPLGGVDAVEFWPVVAAALGGGNVDGGPVARKTVRALLVASAAIGRAVTLLLDDADRGGDGLWDQVAALVRMADGVTGHTVVIATAGELPPADLTRRIDLRAELRPFDHDETASYVAHRLADAGDVSFAADALTELHAATAGVAAAIDRVADLALIAAHAADSQTVTADLVRSAAAELRPNDESLLVHSSAGNRSARFTA